MANYFLNKRAVLFVWCMALSVYAYTEIPAAQKAPLSQEQTQTEMIAAVSQAQAPVQGILSIADCKALEEQYSIRSCCWTVLTGSGKRLPLLLKMRSCLISILNTQS